MSLFSCWQQQGWAGLISILTCCKSLVGVRRPHQHSTHQIHHQVKLLCNKCTQNVHKNTDNLQIVSVFKWDIFEILLQQQGQEQRDCFISALLGLPATLLGCITQRQFQSSPSNIKWLPGTERIYNRHSYAIKNQRKTRNGIRGLAEQFLKWNFDIGWRRLIGTRTSKRQWRCLNNFEKASEPLSILSKSCWSALSWPDHQQGLQ